MPNVDFQVLPTPNPAEVMFRVRQDSNTFKPTNIPVLYSAYKDGPYPIKPRVGEGWGDYQYVKMEQELPYIWLYYGKNKTLNERNTAFQTSYSTRYYPWPPVLYNLFLVQTSSFPQSIWNGNKTTTAPRIFPRYRFKPTPNVSSVIKIEQFLAAIPYPQNALTHPQPIPTEINADVLGANINFPRCLHPRVVFSELVPGANIIPLQGAAEQTFIDPLRRVFPETNFIDWSQFIIEDQVQYVNGLSLREMITIFPPIQPDDILS